jgi:hypothetical protein
MFASGAASLQILHDHPDLLDSLNKIAIGTSDVFLFTAINYFEGRRQLSFNSTSEAAEAGLPSR